MIKKIILTIIFLSFTTLAFSAPVIDDVLSENGFLTITGSGFSTKASGTAPILWEQWDDDGASDGDDLADNSDWNKFRGFTAYYESEDVHSGTLCAFNNAVYPGGDSEEFATAYTTFAATDNCYYSYWWKGKQKDSSNYTIGKLGRITAGTYTSSTNYYSSPNQTISNWNPAYGNTYCAYTRGDGLKEQVNYIPFLAEDEWHFIEMYSEISTAGVNDGKYEFRVDGTTVWADETAKTRANGETFQWSSVILGLMPANLATNREFSFYVDDVYVDNTRDRVMAGTNPTYTSNTGFMMQDPTDTTPDADGWDATEIVVNYNQISSSLTEYVFVIVDNVASNSYPLTEGGVGGSQEPPIVNDCTVSGVSASILDDGDAVVISGIDFGASGNAVYICDDLTMGGALTETQTITDEGTTSIDFTAVQGSFSDGDTAWLFVKDDQADISNGLQISWYLEPAEETYTEIPFRINGTIVIGDGGRIYSSDN